MDYLYELMVRQGLPLPHWALVGLAGVIVAGIMVSFVGGGPVLYVYAERKIAGFMQDRLGPMRVGPYGVLQTIADTVKLLFKEAIYPRGVDRKLFVLAPTLVVVGAFLSFAVLPFGSRAVAVNLNVGVFYVVSDGVGTSPWRVKVKSPCFNAIGIFHVLARGMYIADIIALIGSLDVVLGEIDR